MATINGARFSESKATQWGAQGSDSLFPADYVNAVNYTLAEYGVKMDLASVSSITDFTDDITVDNAADEHVISKGVDMWLSRFGNFQSKNVDPQWAGTVFEKALSVAMTRRDIAVAAAATVEGDVIGVLDE